MWSPKHRLRRSADIQQVRRQGQSWPHPLAILWVMSNALPFSRFAFVASKRVGKAVTRNRARRLLRECVRLSLTQIKPGWDCLFIARPLMAQATFTEVNTAVLQLLAQAKLLSEANPNPVQDGTP